MERKAPLNQMVYMHITLHIVLTTLRELFYINYRKYTNIHVNLFSYNRGEGATNYSINSKEKLKFRSNEHRTFLIKIEENPCNLQVKAC